MARVLKLTWCLAFCLWALLIANVASAACQPGEKPGPWTGQPFGTGARYFDTTDDWVAAIEGENINQNLYFELFEEYGYGSQDADGYVGHTGRFYGRWKSDGSIQGTYTWSISRPSPAPLCTPPPPPPQYDCSSLANVKTLGSANDQPDSFAPQDTICVKNGNVDGASTPLNCAAFRLADQPYKVLGPTGARDHLVRYQFTGLACDAEPEQPPTEPMDTDDESEKCKTGPTGLQWCEGVEDPTGNNCGFFNGTYTCLKAMGTDKCFTKADGSRLCVESAPTPPVPDNGTPGQKAPPDDQMQVCTGQGACTQYNYYNTTTNSNSSRPTGSGGNTDGSGGVGPGGSPAGSGTGNGTEDGTGDDSASGGVACDAAPTCSGDPIQCAQLMQQWRTRCDTRPTDQQFLDAIGATNQEKGTEAGPQDASVEVSGVEGGTVWGGGSCPAPITVSVMGQSMSLDVWQRGCEMAVLFAPFVLAMGYFAAAMLLIKGGTV